MSTTRLLGTFGVAALGAAIGAALLAGCSEKSGGGSGSSANAATSNKSAGALLVDAGDAMEKGEWKAALADVDLVIADAKASVEDKSTAWQDKVVCEGRLNGDA